MLTKPRTVCFCQPVAATISARLTPLERFIMADNLSFLVAALFRALLRPGGPRSLGRGLLRFPLGRRYRRRRLRTVRGQTRDRLPNAHNCGLAAGELLDRLQFVERRYARKAVPSVD